MKKVSIIGLVLVLCLSISAVLFAEASSGIGQICVSVKNDNPEFFDWLFGEDATIGDCASYPAKACTAAQETNSVVVLVIDGVWYIGPFDQFFNNVGDCVSYNRTGKYNLPE